MHDPILHAFLQNQNEAAMALSENSSLLNVVPLAGNPSNHFIAEFSCKGLVGDAGRITEAEKFAVGIRFDRDYLRRPVDVGGLLMWLYPRGIFHPNISPPYICIGSVRAGTPLVELLYRIFELITWDKFTPREDDALCPAACSWARRNMDRFPIDSRPLKWRGNSSPKQHRVPQGIGE